jgi:hypothetical protein
MSNVNKILDNMEEVKEMNDKIKNMLQIIVFICLTALPFITVTNILGIETFLDSFENPDSYVCYKDSGNLVGLKTDSDRYILLQKTNHPDFNIEKSDIVLYCKIDGEIACEEVSSITGIGNFRRYLTKNYLEYDEEVIYQSQIIGKVIKIIDNNIWNEMSLKIWEISINNLKI